MRCLSPGVISHGSRGSISLQDVDCSVVVAVQYETASRTPVGPDRKGLGHQCPTAAAIDACIVRQNLLKPATSFFRFVCQYIEKAAPAGIGYAL